MSQRPGNSLRHHRKLRHATHAGQNIDGREHQTKNCQLVDAPILVDVDETNGGIHQKIDLVKQERGVAVQRINVAQNLPGIFLRGRF